MRHAALALALVAGAVAQAAHAQVKLPFSPPPRLAVASGVDPKTDSLECAYHTVRFIWEIQTLTEKRDGVDVRTAMPVRRNIFESRVVSIPLDKARVFDAAGQELSKAEVILRLTPDSVIALSADGNPVDPLYLKALAKDTLVVASIDYAVNNVDASGASPAIYPAPMPMLRARSTASSNSTRPRTRRRRPTPILLPYQLYQPRPYGSLARALRRSRRCTRTRAR